MLNPEALAEAKRIFTHTHGSVSQCFDRAIARFKEIEDASAFKNIGPFQVAIADSDAGPGTAIVITGFQNSAQLKRFMEGFSASGK